jgi:hypothetical protein
LVINDNMVYKHYGSDDKMFYNFVSS